MGATTSAVSSEYWTDHGQIDAIYDKHRLSMSDPRFFNSRFLVWQRRLYNILRTFPPVAVIEADAPPRPLAATTDDLELQMFIKSVEDNAEVQVDDSAVSKDFEFMAKDVDTQYRWKIDNLVRQYLLPDEIILAQTYAHKTDKDPGTNPILQFDKAVQIIVRRSFNRKVAMVGEKSSERKLTSLLPERNWYETLARLHASMDRLVAREMERREGELGVLMSACKSSGKCPVDLLAGIARKLGFDDTSTIKLFFYSLPRSVWDDYVQNVVDRARRYVSAESDSESSAGSVWEFPEPASKWTPPSTVFAKWEPA